MSSFDKIENDITSPDDKDSFKNNILSKISHLERIQKTIGYRQTEKEEEFINTIQFYINKLSIKLSKFKHFLDLHQKKKRSKSQMIFGENIDLEEKRDFVLSSEDNDISLEFVESLSEYLRNANAFANKIMNYQLESLEIMRISLRAIEDAYQRAEFDLDKITHHA
jgi:hypothetical protein